MDVVLMYPAGIIVTRQTGGYRKQLNNCFILTTTIEGLSSDNRLNLIIIIVIVIKLVQCSQTVGREMLSASFKTAQGSSGMR